MLPPFKKFFWILGIAIFLLILFLPSYTRIQELKDKNADFEAKTRRLNIENYLLQLELKRIENDPVYQEKITREKMGIVRKGEIPIKIINETSE
jgi:cell division protein FtsB